MEGKGVNTEDKGINDAFEGVFDEEMLGDDGYVRGWAMGGMDSIAADWPEEWEELNSRYRDDADHIRRFMLGMLRRAVGRAREEG